jgi:hypothetical protein
MRISSSHTGEMKLFAVEEATRAVKAAPGAESDGLEVKEATGAAEEATRRRPAAALISTYAPEAPPGKRTCWRESGKG